MKRMNGAWIWEHNTRGFLGFASKAGVSIIGTLFLMGALVYLRKLKGKGNSFWRFLFSLVLIDLLSALTLSYGSISLLAQVKRECEIQGFLVQVLFQLSTLYVLVITIWIYWDTMNTSHWSMKTEILIHTIVWIYPIALAILPLLKIGGIHYSGTDTSWCWLDEQPTYARFALFYIYNWLAILVIIGIRIFVWIRNYSQSIELIDLYSSQRAPVFRHLFWYPMAFLAIWLPCGVNRIVQALAKDYAILTFIESFLLPLQGAVNAIVFVLTTKLILEFKNRVRRVHHTEHTNLLTQ